MLSSYRALLARSGAGQLAFACALGWLSFTGYGFAIILAVHAATGSFAEAGGAVAAFSTGSGLAAPIRGRLIDARGPKALGFFAIAHGGASALLVVGCADGGAPWFLVVAAGLAGVFAPPLIATARAIWTEVAGPDLAGTAHALNASLADAAQLLSPALTGVLAAVASPVVALVAVLTGATSAAAVIAFIGRERPPVRARHAPHRVWGVLRESPGRRTVVTCDVGIGLWVGALEVAVTVVAARGGAPELGAVPLSASAVGSILVSLWSGTGRVSRPAVWRYVVGCCIVAATLLLAPVVQSLGGVTVVVAAAGGGFGFLNVALFELLDRIVPTDRAVEAFTWLTTGQAAGTAAGAAVAGQLAKTSPTATLWLVCCSAVAVAIVAVARRRTLEGDAR